jgi:hypothetical protein
MTEVRDRVQRAVADLEVSNSSVRLTAGEQVFNAAQLYYAAKLALADCHDRVHGEGKLHIILQTVSLAFDLNIAKRWPQ